MLYLKWKSNLKYNLRFPNTSFATNYGINVFSSYSLFPYPSYSLKIIVCFSVNILVWNLLVICSLQCLFILIFFPTSLFIFCCLQSKRILQSFCIHPGLFWLSRNQNLWGILNLFFQRIKLPLNFLLLIFNHFFNYFLCLFRSEMRFVIFLLNNFFLWFFCFAVFNLHVYKFLVLFLYHLSLMSSFSRFGFIKFNTVNKLRFFSLTKLLKTN